MWVNPDSSLAILSAINRDSLQGDENQAYYALLFTQAQFRCNGNCTSDSLINFASDYYSDNHNREHYTRSLIYKGSYYEERDNPVEAIKWYKQAEDNADSTDYRNLAQVNKHDGIMDKVSSQFPQLTVPELNFIALMCCDFSSAAIAVCKGYRNIDSVRSRRMKIRDKMGIEGTLTKYIATLKTAN